MNDIEIGNDDGIPLIENILKEPNQRKCYEIEYAGKEYKLSDEALFELVVELFRKKIEYENIIEEIELFFPIENETLLNRMMNAITGLEGEEYEQRKKLNKILDVHERYSQWKRRIERNGIKVEWNKPYSYETEHYYGLQYSTKQRTEMKYCTLNNYCVFIASRHFETLEDHINLVKSSKKFMCNMEKFF